jgi:photosystem II stability/assembly factor-like uncharacterized protein
MTPVYTGLSQVNYPLELKFFSDSNAIVNWECIIPQQGSYFITTHSDDGGYNFPVYSDSRGSIILKTNDSIGYKYHVFPGTGSIYKTLDAGHSWVNVLNLNTPSYFFSCDFLNQDTGWVLGALQSGNKVLLRTYNGASSWDTIILPQSDSFSLVSFENINSGFMYSMTSGKIYKTTDSGINWIHTGAQLPASSTSSFYYGIKMFTSGKGWIWGKDLRRTTDGGASWELQLSTEITDAYFFDENSGWIIKYNPNQLLFTSDSGNNWIAINPYNHYRQVDFIDRHKGWVLCEDGVLLRTRNGGITSAGDIEGNFCKDFTLLQNYPNPFNPSTRISYSIPAHGKVLLKVYDALGREVSKLVDEEKAVGNYEIEFNADGLASGMYFYRLSAGDIVISKKMILLK